jgi:UDP-2,3-diacylglucosamine pyrophosphatase LpxH
MDRWLFIISDLHISVADLDDFDPELEEHLVAFLSSLCDRREPVELILNGDFLDFVQAPPWSGKDLESATSDGIPLCFTEEQSISKLCAIEAAHERTFVALKNFLSSNENNILVILPGNHDPDFFWPAVQDRIKATVQPTSSSGRVHFCLSRSYRPVGCPWLWIEHGHQLDDVNSFFVRDEEFWSEQRPPILTDAYGKRRLLECTGSRFLVRYLNGIDARYPYVDNVKPFSRFLRIFGVAALTPGRGPLDAAIAVTKMLAYLAGTAITRPVDLLGLEDENGDTVPHALAAWIMEASDAERLELGDALRRRGFNLPIPLEALLDRDNELARLIDFLADNSDLVERLGEKNAALLGEQEGTLTLKRGFTANETEDLYRGASHIASGDVTTVVMGHTHEAIERAKSFTYFNTGSWTRYYRFAEHEPTAAWNMLRERSYERFPFHLRYVVVKPGASFATMETWFERSKT